VIHRVGSFQQVLDGSSLVAVVQAPQSELFAQLPERSVQAIVTDPPYAKAFWPLYRECGEAASRVLVDHGDLQMILPHCLLNPNFSSLASFPELVYRWTLCLDQRMGSYARLPNNHRHIACAFKMVGWWYRPAPGLQNHAGVTDLAFLDQASDVVDRLETEPPSKAEHKWEQSAGWARYCLSTLFHTQGVVVDPMVGTGTLAVEALRAGYRVICGDVDGDAVELTLRRLQDEGFMGDLP
jgi:16S rRNA G966 N2-methylase RsmD